MANHLLHLLYSTKTITDVDGKFTITKKSINSFSVSYIGFVKKTIKVSGDKNFYYVDLNEKSDDLQEVIISNDNPALAIIKKTISKKRK
jgi:hypothetical protein